VPTGPTKRDDFEKGKQKAKAQKPPYKDKLDETRDTRDPGGIEPTYITLQDAVSGKFLAKTAREDHRTAVDVYCRQLRGKLHRVGRWKFKFKFTTTQFAHENGITLAEAQKEFELVRTEADDRFTMTRKRALETPLVDGRLRFETLLPTVESLDWSKTFRAVEICPIDPDCQSSHHQPL